ncbi:amino acid adenylation domain-containing protein [Peribacillus simplex]|uniref:non-ribosomal peptide synthetase family protein n=1 Tax=Peribacillus simplex TaxID=1478 RepID=UPI00285369E5|nr:amino acid adenylation domain-containing protein [Peribacillus simplex]MDR4928358.1 amino acid adenylation domain-containing protein [Peribacillus simplex]
MNNRFLQNAFELMVTIYPNNIAIKDKDIVITYKELDKWANALAHLLVKKGINEGDRVAIASERSISLIVAMLATLKSGAAYVPLDPSYPLDRLSYCIEKAEVNVLMTDGSVPDLTFNRNSIDLSVHSKIRAEDPPIVLINDETPAYIIFTSGSTGRPKGVVIPHRAIVNHMQWMQKEFAWTKDDVFLQKTASGFDASVWEIFAPLSSGATMVIGSSNPFDIATDIKRHEVTVVQFVPTVLKLLSELELLSDFTSLRLLFCGGESLQTSLVKKIQKNLPIPIINLYGPTEAAIDTTYRVCLPDENHLFREIDLGQPIDNASVHVVDEEMNILGTGCEGELLISGEGLALGYFGLPDVTKEKFIICPSTGQLSYLTGDLVYIREDGNYEFRGRKDLQIKLRGLRIELGEIEETIREVSFVKDIVVEVREEVEEQWLVAYIRCDSKSWDEIELRSYIEKRLPAYMIPNFFVQMDSFPYLENGKMNRRELSLIPFRSNNNFDGIHDKWEQVIASIWEDVIGEKIHSATTSFASVGGHSLQAIRLANLLSTELQISLTHGFVFLYPTIRKQADYLKKNSLKNGKNTVVPKKLDKKKQKFDANLEAPLSLGQQGILFFEQEEGASQYHIAFLLNFEKGKTTKIEKAISYLRRRHPILSSRIILTDNGEYIQKYDGSLNSEMIKYSVTEANLRKVIQTEAERKFEFNKGGFRASLFSTDKAEYLLLTFHHLIVDGWSSQLFVDELHELIETDLVENKEMKAAFFQFAHNQNSMDFSNGLKFWEEYLEQIPNKSRFSTSMMKGSTQTINGKQIKFSLTKELEQKILSFSQNTSITEFSIHLAMAAYVLARMSGQRDICIGVPVANRTYEQDFEAIGNYVNVAPFRINFTEDATLNSISEKIAQDYAEIIKYEHIPIEKIIQSVVKSRNSDYRPLFQVMFVYNRFLKKQPYTQFKMESLLSDTSKCDLSFIIEHDGENSTFTIEYCNDLFTDNVISEVKQEWISQMQKIADETIKLEIQENSIEATTIENDKIYHADKETLIKVQNIWKDIFRNSDHNLNSNFFEIGGHSLLAMKFIAQLNKKFELTLPVSIVFDYPTIQGIAHVITNSIKPNGVVHVSPAVNRQKIWFIHPAGGALWCYKEMATELNKMFDVWGIESAEIPESDKFEDDLLNMAKRYASYILSVQQEGPYYITGYSFGGNVAYEIARSFEAEGRDVGLLTLLDCHFSKAREFDKMEFVNSYALKFTNGANDKFNPDELTLMGKEELLEFLLNLGKDGGHLHMDAEVEDVKSGLGIWEANNIAIHRYNISGSFYGKVLFIRAEENEHDTTVGWENYLAGDLTVRSVPAQHFTIYKSPNAENVAEIIMEQVASIRYV